MSVTVPRRVDPAEVARNVAAVRSRLERAGGAGRVRLVAVTKTFGADAVLAALAAGVHDIGENYAQELEEKAAVIGDAGVRWHMIGHVQRNKVRRLASIVQLWQTVDRAELGAEIARRSPGAQVFVQVNVSGEAQKAGCAPGDVNGLVSALRAQDLDVRGVMAVGPAGDATARRAAFQHVATLAEDLGLPELSMGMSDDLEIAVECGATMVRIGRDLFGARNRLG